MSTSTSTSTSVSSSDCTHDRNAVGQLFAIIGPMFAGKTSRMIYQMDILSIRGKKCAVIMHQSDTRFGGMLKTHDGRICGLPFAYTADLNSQAAQEIFLANDVIGIDEIQFFVGAAGNVEQFVGNLVGWIHKGKTIICTGLDTDYRQVPFSVIGPLVSQSDGVKKLKAVCVHCLNHEAIFSARSQSDPSIYVNAVGGKEKYVAVCRACFEKHHRAALMTDSHS